MAEKLVVKVTRMALIELSGEIDLAGLDDLHAAIEPNLAAGQTVVLDLTDVTFADSTFLNTLTQARAKATEIGAAIFLRNPAPHIHKLLAIGELDDLVQAEVDRQNELD